MDFAQNLLDYPIYGKVPGAGQSSSRLYQDTVNGQVVDANNNIIIINARTGNPEITNGTPIPQPTIAQLVQVMVQDGITAHMRTGVLTAPVVPAGPVISNFDLLPARVNTNIIDYTTKEGMRLYNIATKLLYKKKKNYLI